MRITVRLFARLRDLAGRGEIERSVDAGATVADVWRTLTADVPALAPYEASMSCAVNAEYARMSATLHDGDEVAFLPPVSGGADANGQGA